MSQFIELTQNIPLEPPIILKGILSKVVEPSILPKGFLISDGFDKQVTFSNSSTFLKTHTDKRFVEEIKIADQLQCIIMNKEYEAMKSNLTKYGKSKSSKIDKIMKLHKPVSYIDEDLSKQNQSGWRKWSKKGEYRPRMTFDVFNTIKKQQRQAKLRYSEGNIYSAKDTSERVVFVDRKHNKEFAIKRASLIETQKILTVKENYREFMTKFRKKEPLVEEVNQKRVKYKSDYQKVPLEVVGLLNKSQSMKNFDKRVYRAKRMRNSGEITVMKSQRQNDISWSKEFFLKKQPSIQMEELIEYEGKNRIKCNGQLTKKKIVSRNFKLQTNFISSKNVDTLGTVKNS